MTPVRPRHARILAGLLAGLLAGTFLSACASPAATSAPGPPGGSGAPAATTSPAGTGTASDTGADAAIDACSLLTEADIKEITGFAVAKVVPNPPDTIFPSACEWHVEDAAWQIVLGVSSPGGQATWNSLVPYTQGDPVAGIGDEAFLAEMGGDLMVRRGDAFIDVQYVAVGEPEGTQDRLAKRVLEHLP